MPRPKLYPLTSHQIEAAVADLVDTGKHLDGKAAAGRKPAYFKNFRFQTIRDADGLDVPVVASRATKFLMRCEVHDVSFETTTRILFNTSEHLTGTTCHYCEREAGVGKHFVTLGELVQQMASDPDFDWVLDLERLPADQRDVGRAVRTDERLPLICKHNKWNSQEKCMARHDHKVGNILWALRGQRRHIVCQGACDSSGFGKWSRMGRSEFEQRLNATRGGDWSLSHPGDYRRVSEEQWFTHSLCGNEVKRTAWQILRQRSAEDCPYCSRRSVLACVAGSLEHFSRWVAFVTEGRVRYTGSGFPESAEQRIALVCQCGHSFEEKLGNLTRYEHHGCEACRNASAKSQRAWVLDEAQAIVKRRGYRLADDPGSYTVEAVLIAPSGERQVGWCVLDLVRALPATAHGFGDAPMSDSGEGAARDRKDKRRHRVNDHAFEFLTHESCYWAGLLAADACASDDAEIVLELKANDELVLQSLAKFLGFAGRFGYRTVKTVGGRGIYCSLRFRSHQICSDLKKWFGIEPRKTRTLPRPHLADPGFQRAYMAGLFDGDGHFRITKRGPTAHFVSASAACFDWFLELANDITATAARPRTIDGREGPVYNVTYHDTAAEKLMRSLRQDYPGHMPRKWLVEKMAE